MYLLLNGILCLILSLGIIYKLNKICEKRELKWVRPNKNYVGSAAISVVIFFVISIISLCILLYVTSLTYSNALLLQIKDSGLMLAIAIAIAGLLTRAVYNGILTFVNKHTLDGLYPLEYSDCKWLFIYSCLMMALLCFGLNFSTTGLTIIAIIIGKFVWFDIALEQKNDELNSLLEVPSLYYVVLFYLFLIIVYACFFENLISGCIAGIVISWIVCLVYSYKNKKSS